MDVELGGLIVKTPCLETTVGLRILTDYTVLDQKLEAIEELILTLSFGVGLEKGLGIG